RLALRNRDALSSYVPLLSQGDLTHPGDLTHRGQHEARVGSQRSLRPTLRHRLRAGIEAYTVHTVLVQVPESRALPAAESVIRDRHRNRHVDTDHSHLDSGSKPPGEVAAAREDRNSVSTRMHRGMAHSFFEGLCAEDLQHRAEDLILVALH